MARRCLDAMVQFFNFQRWVPVLIRGEFMKSSHRFPIALAIACLCFVFITIPAYGYADPNTVGLLSQVLTPLLITAGACVTFLRKSIGVAFAGLWQRLRRRGDA